MRLYPLYSFLHYFAVIVEQSAGLVASCLLMHARWQHEVTAETFELTMLSSRILREHGDQATAWPRKGLKPPQAV